MADEHTTKAQPRPEARPVAWGELTSHQRAAAEQLCALLAEQSRLGKRSRFYERDRQRTGLMQVLPPIELKRWAGVHLIDGDRGAGKTALLVSLLHHWGQVALARPAHFPQIEEVPGLLPIGLFDLRDLPRQTALKVHLASMLRRIYEFVAGRPSDPVPLPGQPRSKDDPLREAWEDFVRATAADVMEFKGRGASDPETFAEDIFAAEKDRFDLPALFCKLVDQLLDRLAHIESPRGDALFLIAIDDADMNPGRVMECLELTQTFAHPRVAYLLTGYEDLYLVALERHFERELRRAERAKAEAQRLAVKFYEKVIPATHRRRLYALAPSERVDRLEGVLATIPIPRTARDAAALFRAFPEFAEILPATIRELLELGRSLEQTGDDARSSRAWQLLKLAYDAARIAMPSDDRRVLDPILGGRANEPKSVRLPVEFATRSERVFDYDPRDSPVAIRRLIVYDVSPLVSKSSAADKPPDQVSWHETTANALVVVSALLWGPWSGDLKLARIVANNLVEAISWPVVARDLTASLLLARSWWRWVAAIEVTPPIEQCARAFVECQILAADLCLDRPVLREWREIVEDLARRGDLDELALLAAPECGLDIATRRLILDAWRANISSEDWSAKRTAWANFRGTRLLVQDWTTLRARYGDDDPWFVATEHEDDLGDLQGILDAPLKCENPWTTRLGQYLTDDLRARLLRDRGSIMELATRLGRAPRSDERQRLASVDQQIGTWTGTRLNVHHHAEIVAERWGGLRTLGEGIEEERVGLAQGKVSWAHSDARLAVQVAFLLALDLSTDRQGSRYLGENISRWPLLAVENPSSGQEENRWFAPSWQTHLDMHMAVEAWNRVCADFEVSRGTIGILARHFVMIQVHTFLRVPHDGVLRSWREVFDLLEWAWVDKRHVGDGRVRAFGAWRGRLMEWLPNMLPRVDRVALVHATRWTAPFTQALLKDLPFGLYPFADARVAVDAMLMYFDSDVRRDAPELFELGQRRREALSRFVDRLRGVRDDGWLTPDLESMLADSSTSYLLGALQRLDGASTQIEGLVALLESSSEVRYVAGRLTVAGVYQVAPAFPATSVINSDVPRMTVQYGRGAIMCHELVLVNDVVRALLAELAEPPPASQDFVPIEWPLARYSPASLNADSTPWPAVQWPRRRDVYAQLAAWHAMLDSDGARPLSSAIRIFIAATIDIYETGQATGVYAGSWNDVITRARRVASREPASPRERAFAAWVEQIPRFALPRVGLSAKYAADILVRFWDLEPTSGAIRSAMRGRLDDYRQQQLGLPIEPEHPARRVAEAKDLDALRVVMDDLRRTYELG